MRPMLKWCRDGIYVLQGPLTGQNLNELYKENDEVLDYLKELLDHDIDYRNRQAIEEAIEDLTTNK